MKLITEKFFDEIRQNAEKRGIPFLLTKKDLIEVFEKQNGKSTFTGNKLEFTSLGYRGTASLDRRENHIRAYTPENIQWVEDYLNQMKRGFAQSFFFNACMEVANGPCCFSRQQL